MKQGFKNLIIALITLMICIAGVFIFFIFSFKFPEYSGPRLKDFPKEVVHKTITDYFKNDKVNYEFEILYEYGPIALAYPKADVFLVQRNDKNAVIERGVAEFSIDESGKLFLDDYRTEFQIKNGDPYFNHIRTLVEQRLLKSD